MPTFCSTWRTGDTSRHGRQRNNSATGGVAAVKFAGCYGQTAPACRSRQWRHISLKARFKSLLRHRIFPAPASAQFPSNRLECLKKSGPGCHLQRIFPPNFGIFPDSRELLSKDPFARTATTTTFVPALTLQNLLPKSWRVCTFCSNGNPPKSHTDGVSRCEGVRFVNAGLIAMTKWKPSSQRTGVSLSRCPEFSL